METGGVAGEKRAPTFDYFSSFLPPLGRGSIREIGLVSFFIPPLLRLDRIPNFPQLLAPHQHARRYMWDAFECNDHQFGSEMLDDNNAKTRSSLYSLRRKQPKHGHSNYAGVIFQGLTI